MLGCGRVGYVVSSLRVLEGPGGGENHGVRDFCCGRIFGVSEKRMLEMFRAVRSDDEIDIDRPLHHTPPQPLMQGCRMTYACSANLRPGTSEKLFDFDIAGPPKNRPVLSALGHM